MPYIIAGIVVVAIIVIAYIIIWIEKTKLKTKIIKEISRHGKLEKSNETSHDFIFKSTESEIALKMVYVGHAKELSINSKRHWQIHRGKGINFVSTRGFEKLQRPKAIVVYPTPKRIVKYINENEVVFVKPLEKCFDFYLLTEESLEKLKKISQEN